MSILNLNSLLSNIFKLLKSFISIYLVHISLAEVMKFTDLRLKLWSSSLKKKGSKKRHGEDFSSVRRGFRWSIREDLEWKTNRRNGWDARKCGTGGKECMRFWILESFTFEWRGWRLKFRLIVESTRLCLGCFNPCVCHLGKSFPLGTKSYGKL